ncbi:hypothetical protein [Bradyrhizobium canariense]|uniref:Uncharacterized protein n=1 Tax=Bradyrhizobium canariense TaxID=255045 RepID=A0A1X3H4G2_9BRAD|nr:hypothetical protein [Bradyrhizobium canariense]OSI90187.1 hypothetical protein BSZ25_18315 [Bradyrhizobium canariense]OSJ03512.1 hypothetical protein BSZ16_15575 [Bradyrhizobium canariense]OSJ06748.1 hypothetical protein BSZ18_21910 [Bradyrhizobium canariense]
MQRLFRTGEIAIGPSSIRLHGWMLFGARLIFWPLVVLTLVSLALQLGAWRKEFTIVGPFAAETNPARASFILDVPQEAPAPWWRQPLSGDNGEKPFQSFLDFRINGREMGPPHTLHEKIRTGKTTGFSHWGGQVIFSLPPDLTNDPKTAATVRYKVRPRAWVSYALAILSALVGYSIYSSPLKSLAARLGDRPKAIVITAPHLMLFGLCWAGLIASAVYLLSILYALAAGWALPTTALIRWSPVAEWAARYEPYFGYLLLMLAGWGTATNWFIGLAARHHQPLLESTEQSLQRLLAWCGFPVAASAFVFCTSAMWAGIVRPGDLDYASIGGLIPFSDAAGYLAGAFDQVKDGVWSPIALRRPLAAGFRSVLLIFGNFSLPSMLILQACVVAGAVCLATYAIVVWRGIWAAIAFFALTYIFDRIFVPTTLTEPLGVFWALLSIPFFIRAFRDHSVTAALLAFTMTSVALMTRMGSMFTIPALVMWLIWQFGKGIGAKLRIAVAATCVLLGVFGLNSLLQNAYGAGPSPSTGNFSYVLCGLSMGTTWDGCLKKLAEEGTAVQGSEDTVARQLYSAAWTHLRAHPGPFFQRLAEGAQTFATEYPSVMWQGYTRAIDFPAWLFPNVLVAISLIGLLHGTMRRAKAVEVTFWILLWASLVASSCIIYLEEGSRVLAASHPTMALFFALGMSNLASTPAELPSDSRFLRNGLIGLIAMAVLFVCVPWLAHHFSSTGTMASATPLPARSEAIVFGGPRMSGFLVINDDQPIRDDVPSLHLADFDAIIGQSGLEYYQGLIHPVLPPLPFGFVFAPRVEKGGSNLGVLYIVPPEVMERREVPAWHFNLKRWGDKNNGAGDYWFYVTKAEPWQPSDR